ncbi:MAG: Rdx family protein [Deltaproteobacteria bacterium]|nr:Rdx family protein [Deltaproteobacteria bacterium]MBW2382894.1 Rdx family protein [Deltaproteobacteria bacterium]MBW2696229.1 Rdx family protein [Deltaproteobacteria bacterium]
MAAAIEQETGVIAELIKGGGGIFDVEVDGEIIFSKKAAGRFPEHEEVLVQLR